MSESACILNIKGYEVKIAECLHKSWLRNPLDGNRGEMTINAVLRSNAAPRPQEVEFQKTLRKMGEPWIKSMRYEIWIP